MAFDPMMAMKLIDTGTRAVTLAARALEAANNDNQDLAEAYLEEARNHYSDARKGWDRA